MPDSDEMTPDSGRDEWLDLILKTDAMTPLSEDFADRVSLKVVKKISLKQSLREFLIYASVIVSTMLIFLVILYFTGSMNLGKWQELIIPRMNLLAGISIILFFILFADRVLLPWLFFKKDKESRNQSL
jgi:hypothetical protein